MDSIRDNKRNVLLRQRWEEANLFLFGKNANLICILLMLLIAPTDFLSFPSEEAWEVVRARFVSIALFLSHLLLMAVSHNRGRQQELLMGRFLLSQTTLVINLLYVYYLLTMDEQYRLAVTTGALTALFGAHLFLYRFKTSHMLFSFLFLVAIMIPFSMDEVWRSYLISILIGHGTCLLITLFFRRVFYQGLEKDDLIKMQNEAIKEQTAEVEQALTEKNNLLRVLMHDISNPLAVIMGNQMMISNQEQGSFDDFTMEKLKKIKKACDSINLIIKHVRDFEAIKSGKKPLDIGPCSVYDCIDQAILMVESKLLDKEVAVERLTSSKDDLVCLADSTNLSFQVLVNILTNAIKFSPKGGKVTIETSVNSESAIIRLSDQGIGMPPKILENLFREDQPTSRKGTEGEPGTGFGMPLVKAYMDRFEGTIEVETKEQSTDPEDHGTSFTLYLPLYKTSETEAAA